MMAGGVTSAALGVCCMGLGALGVASNVISHNINECGVGGGVCLLLGAVSTAFGVPVAFLGGGKLDEAEELKDELRERRARGDDERGAYPY